MDYKKELSKAYSALYEARIRCEDQYNSDIDLILNELKDLMDRIEKETVEE